ncbi:MULTISPECIES: MDR family MFS transporter [unclassified Enterococcus]|uniref:MDR family MFS transporter n=1 Tax=unclassified Enterococcus TaxID=2608891 RepID=UPI00155472DE|nr:MULTISPECIES: MDR family MFS transporter [unclassified Enterococcus]MBS7578188.1 DHA2 family efflux MFS transporter permease subunit [Enterococcus sp. MMGLQ5-2]MBS7585436.1 DHA2 family efflux MFS transporter permease subunit [Enterococcus sp. MMGLQ5-1]NPD13293.1 DHA2 family efflux MFS transporter permease subunit [Enterococcus sp. MMGLQ5-1]NPD38019.1 DHA2 family efflux MFS transporter permease subunit [Enterococcus sp. MMGLQ5-2]
MTRRNKITVIVLILGSFLAVLNQTTMNPALPSVMNDLAVSATTAQWLVSGFTLVNAIVIAISAFLMDRFSTRKLFIGSFLFFLLGSSLGAWGLNFPMLLVGRFLQAITSGIMLPMSMTVLLLVYPREKRGSAMGLYNLVLMFAPAIGPTISGILTDKVGWRMMFLFMAALSAVIIFIAAIFLKNFGEQKAVTLDKISVLQSSLGLFSLLYGFSQIADVSMRLPAIILIIVGVLILLFFARRQLKLSQPFLEIRVLKDKQYLIGVVISMLIQASLSAAAITLPLYIQNVLGLSATISGLIMMPGAILGALSGFLAGKIFDRFGARYLAIFGVVLISAGSFGMVLFNFDTTIFMIMLCYAIRSIGLMFANTPVNTWSISNLSDEVLNHGNALSSTLRQVASTLCTAIMVSVMSIVASQANNPASIDAELKGVQVTFLLGVLIALIALILVIFKIRNKDLKEIDEADNYDLKEAMNSTPYTVLDTDDIKKVIQIFTSYRTSGLPVVDIKNRLVGFISDGDILRFLSKNDYVFTNSEGFTLNILDRESFSDKIQELLQKNVMTVAFPQPLKITTDMSLMEVIKLFSEQKKNKVAVTKDEQLIGTISRVDLMKFMMKQIPID